MAFEVGTGGSGGSFIPPTPSTPAVPQAPSPVAPVPAAATTGYAPPPLPDWSSVIASSPYAVAANALAAQQLASLRAQLGSNAARALVNLGDMSLADQVSGLTLPGNTGGLVDQANKAGTSVLSRLLYQHGLNTTSIPAGLAGRGFYRSGETGYMLGQENRSYGNQQYSARQSTLDYLNGLYQNYLNSQFGIQQQQLAAYMSAYQSALANIGAYVTPAGGSQAPTGPPVYNPVTAPYGLNAAGQPVDLSGVGYNTSTGQFLG